MAKTKTASTKAQKQRTGTKTTARRAAGKTATATGEETDTLPRSARKTANAIWARTRRSPKFLDDVLGYIRALQGNTRRVAQVEPRSNGGAAATQH